MSVIFSFHFTSEWNKNEGDSSMVVDKKLQLMAACSFGRTHGPLLSTLFPLSGLQSPVLSIPSLHNSHIPSPRLSVPNSVIRSEASQISVQLQPSSTVLEVASPPVTPSVPVSIHPLDFYKESSSPAEDIIENGKPLPKNQTKSKSPVESSDSRTL